LEDTFRNLQLRDKVGKKAFACLWRGGAGGRKGFALKHPSRGQKWLGRQTLSTMEGMQPQTR
jgi:hypothetical protein